MDIRKLPLFGDRGTVGRALYFGVGITLFAVKHLIDRIVATQVFGLSWSLFNYWVIGEETKLDEVPYGHLRFYATLIAISVPFIWIGIVLTLGRLRDIGWPLWLVAVFFVPFVNLLFFLILSIIPSREAVPLIPELSGLRSIVDGTIPHGRFGSAVFGIVFTSVLTIALTVLGIFGLANYGWGIFVGLPFFLGLSTVLIYSYHERRSLGSCVLVSLLSIGLTSALLIAVAIEGAICIVMIVPLGGVMAIFGGFIGWVIQNAPRNVAARGRGLQVFAVVFLAMPVLLLAEHFEGRTPPLRKVTTAIEISAAPEKVWEHVVEFNELPPPTDWIFSTGIAYPIRAEIHGKGKGSIRRCVFSTGAFVEPIEVWDEPNLLQFSVSEQPPVMDEFSPYSKLEPPHLNRSIQSKRGQFLLTVLPNGNTRLEGTTWYYNEFDPAPYWNVWSDLIIHRIHRRVLNHIAASAEQR